ncbi:1-phosphofructokinase family hexose kinase [Conexibacter arvalis]|uniref:1-phosphofructokinase family hexose kinase n=1 Tax=Conexibacter arvalis TaxID=912552 RepID=A0A840I8F4_9ACTN|nr:PfkB family carbohydrate kinase [Conexibacter arvalis]MBB4661189.1 1-phosphofructokinase family hexose kinase [Conexibacter arvalis]
MIAALAPNPSIDRFFLVADQVRAGAIHRPAELVATAGGKGLNVARAAATLGGDVRAIALLAGHAGRWIADELLDNAIRADVVWTTGETRTSLSAADPESGRPTEFYERGESTDPAAWERFAERVSAVTDARWASVSGSLPPGVPASASADLVERARETGARVAVGQSGAALTAALGAAPDLVKANANEAHGATGHDQPRSAALALHDLLSARREALGLGAPATIVTAGEDGAYLVDPSGSLWRGSVDARGPFPNGSGDSFLGGLLVALDAEGDGEPRWPETLPLALGAAAANAERAGAGKLDPRRARALAAQAVVTSA